MHECDMQGAVASTAAVAAVESFRDMPWAALNGEECLREIHKIMPNMPTNTNGSPILTWEGDDAEGVGMMVLQDQGTSVPSGPS